MGSGDILEHVDLMIAIHTLIDELVDSKTTVAHALTKAKLIAHRIKARELSEWAAKELGGYSADDKLPSYRSLSCTVKALQVGPLGQKILVPVLISEPSISKLLYLHRVTQSISMLEEVVAERGKIARHALPTPVAIMLAEGLTLPDSIVIEKMYQEVNVAQLRNIIEMTKQKIIDALLLLEETLPAHQGGNQGYPEPPEGLKLAMQATIYDSDSLSHK